MYYMFNFFGLSDKGEKKDFQEDSFYGFERNNVLFLMIADGMGSKEGLDVASVMAINQAVNYIERYFPVNSKYNIPFLKTLIDGAFYNANREIIAYKRANESLYNGLVTTFTLCAITNNKEFIMAHIGNTRLYILRNGNLVQLTKDHTEAKLLLDQKKITNEELRIHPARHTLTKCLGLTYDFKYDLMEGKLNTKDLIFMCSDGVYDLMFDEEIKGVLAEATESKTACEWFIQGANQRGGYDNISTLISFINF